MLRTTSSKSMLHKANEKYYSNNIVITDLVHQPAFVV